MLLIVFISLIISAWIDWKQRTIPDWLTLPMIAFALLYQLLFGNVLISALSGGIVFLFLLTLALFTKGGIGGGDIKLFTFLGVALGFPMIGTLLMFSFILGILYGKIAKQKEIPLAPATLLGFILVVPLYSPQFLL
ncbi:prepilin peptidase [Brevibacillus marinus]|uniref:prepilin peptidase n=1 Tax=Brevibacillus marinus TaxID=2496837 RepID=UPI000F831565|nr:A24 family peptidase [Brevibacillus marinus]